MSLIFVPILVLLRVRSALLRIVYSGIFEQFHTLFDAATFMRPFLRYSIFTGCAAFLVCIGLVTACLHLGMRNPASTTRADRSYCLTALAQIRGALEQYREFQGRPVSDVVSDSGEPLLSWRVPLSRYLSPPRWDINLAHAWNSNINLPYRYDIPLAYRCITDSSPKSFSSFVMARCRTEFAGDNLILPRGACIVELHGRRIWTQPGDIDDCPSLEELLQRPEVYSYHNGQAHVLHADGTIQEIEVRNMKPPTIAEK